MELKTAQSEPGKEPVDTVAKQGFLGLGDKEPISIVRPMTFWIGVLLLGLVFTFVLAPITKAYTPNYFASIGRFILYQPGAIILPLIVAVWMSEKIGIFKTGPHVAVKTALLNAVYIAAIYVIAIFIIYLIGNYFGPGALPTAFTLNGFVINLVVVPAAIVIALIPFLSMLSAARHSAA